MDQQQEWKKWRRQELNNLSQSIAWASKVFSTAGVEIDRSRHYGTALLAHSVECARAIHLCVRNGIPGPAFSLIRVQYEGALRGHIIIHEIDLEELNDILRRMQKVLQNQQLEQSFPMIEIKGDKWKILGTRSNRKFRNLQHDTARIFTRLSEHMNLFHDFTHSGMTQALMMRDEHGNIGPSHSKRHQTALLTQANMVVVFAITIWPGATQKYGSEIERWIERLTRMRGKWDPDIGI